MTLIDGDKIITAQVYDDRCGEITEMKISIIDYVNAFVDEGVTTADDVLGKIRAEIEEAKPYDGIYIGRAYVLKIIDKYRK